MSQEKTRRTLENARAFLSPRSAAGRRGMAAVVLYLGVSLLLIGRQMNPDEPRPGAIAQRDIHASRDAEYIDTEATEAKRKRTAAAVKRVYNVLPTFSEGVKDFFTAFRDRILAENDPEETVVWLTFQGLTPETAREMSRIADLDRLVGLRLGINTIQQRLIEAQRLDEDQLLGLETSAIEACRQAGVPTADIRIVSEIFTLFIKRNLSLDGPLYEKMKAEAAAAAPPVKTAVRKGEIIVRKGDPITQAHMDVVKALGMNRTGENIVRIASNLGVVFLCLFLMGVLLKKFHPRYYREEKSLNLYILLILISAAIFRVLSEIDYSPYTLALPIGSFTMFVCVLMRPGVALVGAAMLSFLFAYTHERSVEVLFCAMTGALAAFYFAMKREDRDSLLKAAGALAVNGAVMVCLMETRHVNYSNAQQFMIDAKAFLVHLTTAPFNALLAFVIVYGALPLFEKSFRVTTPRRLLELSNPEEPLLKKLLLEAPGTYHHSLMVANLTESAVKQMGGDALLVRVAALYHDIGKSRRPQFFTENQAGGRNPHDELTPTMSAMVIQGHVKDGVDIALREKLPPEIIDFIRTHHGTSFISFFYKKARSQARPDQAVEEEMFRYPGPKPFTLEQAVMMLADGCEAASRSLKEPTARNIETLVNAIFEDRLEDGQLNASPITLAQIEIARQTFVRMLTTLYHSRMEYPKFENGEANKPAPAKRAEPEGTPAETPRLPNAEGRLR